MGLFAICQPGAQLNTQADGTAVWQFLGGDGKQSSSKTTLLGVVLSATVLLPDSVGSLGPATWLCVSLRRG